MMTPLYILVPTHDSGTRTQCHELLVVACFYVREEEKNKSLEIKRSQIYLHGLDGK